MAYLKKNDLVIIPRAGGGNLQARVVDMQFRRFKKTWQDKASGEYKSRWKSVPYAICSVFAGGPVGAEFLIPGYKLKGEKKQGESILVLRDKYAAEFNEDWAKKIITESKVKRAS